MSSADLWEDDYPHGTVDGYDGGCRGGACPADAEIGMSCKRAKALAAGDFRYNRLVAAGKTPAEIAAVIDGREAPTPPATATKPTPAPKPRPPRRNALASGDVAPAPQPADEPAAEPTPSPVIETPAEVSIAGTPTTATTSADTTPTPQDLDTQPAPEEPTMTTQPTPVTTEKYTAGLNQGERTFVLRHIRDWARANGFPGVPSMGRIPKDALAAFDAAHPHGIVDAGLAQATPAGVAGHVAQLRAIREWARKNGWPDVADRGPVSDEIREAYDDAHTSEADPIATDVDTAVSEPDTIPADAGITEPKPDTEDVGDGTPAPEREDEGESTPALADSTLEDFAADLEVVRDRAGVPTHIKPGVLLVEESSFTTATTNPEWAEVAAHEDVERARNIAVLLEGQNALLVEQLHASHAILTSSLEHNADLRDRIKTLRTQIQDTERDALSLNTTLGIAESSNTLLKTRIDELEAELAEARKPWWKRTTR